MTNPTRPERENNIDLFTRLLAQERENYAKLLEALRLVASTGETGPISPLAQAMARSNERIKELKGLVQSLTTTTTTESTEEGI